MAIGEARWLTVVSPEAPDGPELALEPGNPAAGLYKAALMADGIPATSMDPISCRDPELAALITYWRRPY